MSAQIIRVDEENDKKLWKLIVDREWSGVCLGEGKTYAFTMGKIRALKRAGIVYEEVKPQRKAQTA